MAKRPAGKSAGKTAAKALLRPEFQIRDRDREGRDDDGTADINAMHRAAAGALPTANTNNDAASTAPAMGSGPDIASATHADIVTLLAQIGARLHQNERERLSIRQSLGDYKHLLENLESKTEQSEKIFLTLQDKLSKQESAEESMRRRQQDLEDRQNDYAERVDKAAGLAGLADRIDAAMADQARLNRRLEKITQDKHRFIRKLERIEETVVETKSALEQKAMVVLADRHATAFADPAGSAGIYTSTPPERRFGLIGVLVACGVIAGLAFALGQAWSTARPSILTRPAAQVYGPQRAGAVAPAAAATPPVLAQTPAQLNARFDADPDALAKDLNALNPGTRPDAAATMATDRPAASEAGFDPAGFLNSQRPAAPLAERIKPDAHLPPVLAPLQAEAFKGSASAQNALASAYAVGGDGVKVDLERAASWFRAAALQDVASAQYNLGVLYAGGNGVKQNLRLALDWYRLAALQGQAGALYNLGVAHIEGRAASYDPMLATRYFRQAADGGMMDAAYNLGVVYEQGLLGKPDKLAALYWYNKASTMGSAPGGGAAKRLTADLRLSPAVVADAVASPPALPGTAAVAAAPLPERVVVARVQEQLIRLGLYPGPADGVDNQATRDAILTYQRLSSLDPDGRASQGLLTDMVQGPDGAGQDGVAKKTPPSGGGTLRADDLSKPGGA